MRDSADDNNNNFDYQGDHSVCIKESVHYVDNYLQEYDCIASSAVQGVQQNCSHLHALSKLTNVLCLLALVILTLVLIG